jgi:hypothetical protein
MIEAFVINSLIVLTQVLLQKSFFLDYSNELQKQRNTYDKNNFCFDKDILIHMIFDSHFFCMPLKLYINKSLSKDMHDRNRQKS